MAKKSKPTKEQIYDAQINPLMAQIITICKAHRIAALCDFDLGLDENGDDDSHLKCTTLLLEDDMEPSPEMFKARDVLYPPKRPAMRLTVKDGDGNTTLIEHIA